MTPRSPDKLISSISRYSSALSAESDLKNSTANFLAEKEGKKGGGEGGKRGKGIKILSESVSKLISHNVISRSCKVDIFATSKFCNVLISCNRIPLFCIFIFLFIY